MRHRLAVASFVIATAIAVAGWVHLSRVSGGRLETAESHDASIDLATTADSRSFALVDQYGHAVTDESFRGEWLIVFFGFTHCPAACPMTLAKLAAALDELGTQGEDVRVALITVDPERDAPEVLAQYLGAVRATFCRSHRYNESACRSHAYFPGILATAAGFCGRRVRCATQYIPVSGGSRWTIQATTVIGCDSRGTGRHFEQDYRFELNASVDSRRAHRRQNGRV